MITTVLVDDHRLFSDGLEKLLNDTKQFNVIKKFDAGTTLLQSIHELQFDLLLIDIEMKGLDGFETIRRLKLINGINFKIVILSMHEELVYKKEAYEIGVNGHICKTINETSLVDNLVKIMNNQVYTIESAPLDKVKSLLSKQEIKVLKLISQGRNSHEISQELSISTLTVKVHRRNILRKLNANNSAESINIAISKGLF
jgi:DNA-binding NarL/FixJ family response regulator